MGKIIKLMNLRLSNSRFMLYFLFAFLCGEFTIDGTNAYTYENGAIKSVEGLNEIKMNKSSATEKQSALITEKKLFGSYRPQGEALFYPLIRKAAKRHNVDAALIMAIVYIESGYNPKATSKKGAQGLMQLMPKTAKALGVKNSFNPEQNINGGVKYFKKLVNKTGGNIELALAAYNAGYKNIRRYNGVPPFKATQYFIKKVLKYYQFYKVVSRQLS